MGTRDAAATATPNPNPGDGPSPLSVPVPGDAASQLVTSSTVHVFTNAAGTVHRVSPTHGRSEDEAATPKGYDLESDEMMEQDLTGGTQIIPGDEDEEIIEAQQKVLEALPDRPMMMLNMDGPLKRYEAIVRKLQTLEAA